jgi:deoxyribodipyrimidine photo-lyase
MYNKSIFIFRRDLRLKDNLGLIEALNNSKNVITIFIFTPEQIDKNSFKSYNAI